jgi:hypothetical protein
VRSLIVSVIRIPVTRRRIESVPAFGYTVPVVREIPMPGLDDSRLGTW